MDVHAALLPGGRHERQKKDRESEEAARRRERVLIDHTTLNVFLHFLRWLKKKKRGNRDASLRISLETDLQLRNEVSFYLGYLIT